MLTVHHLNISASERIVWLCEELALNYTLVLHTRDPKTKLSPPSLTSLPGNPTGTAPLIQDGAVTLSESAAIVEYIIHKHGNGRLAVSPNAPNYADYLYWFHFANGSLQARMSTNLMLSHAGGPGDNPVRKMMWTRLQQLLANVDRRLRETGAYLAGDEFTAADIMSVFSLTTMRQFLPMSFGEYPNIVEYLCRIGKREGYRRAMEKGDNNMELLLGAEPSSKSLM